MLKRVFSVGVIVAILGAVLWFRPDTKMEEVGAHYPINRVIKYRFLVKNPTNKLLAHAKFWTHAPVKLTAQQKMMSVDVNSPYKMDADAAGNQRLLISLENIPPFGSKTVVVSAVMSMAQAPNRLNESVGDQYLKAEPFIEVDDPAIQRIAQTLKGDSVTETLEKTYHWVTRHLENVEYIKRDRGALYALQHRQADCTGYMYLFTALARANRIFARPVAGFVYAEDTIARSSDYHNWVEAYVDGVWRVIDPQKQRFMENENHYIAMQLLDSLDEQTAGSAQRLFRSDGAIQLAMK